MAENGKNGWAEFRQLFLKTVEDFDKLRNEVVQLKIDIAVIKVKLFMWGAIGAMVGTGLFNFVIEYIKAKSGK